MARQRALAALILLGSVLSACAPAGRGPEQQAAGGEIDVTAELEAKSPREGDLGTVVFRVRNASKNVVILRDLTLVRDLMVHGGAGAVASWQYSQPGVLTFIPERGEWLYDRTKKTDTRRPIFNSGLLVPGEAIEFRARVRLLQMPMDFQFSFFELPPDEVRRKVFFEVRQEREIRYRLLVGKELDLRMTPGVRTDVAGHRFVIFPHAEPGGSTNSLLKTIRVQTELRPRPFTLAEAAQRAATPRPAPHQYTFSRLLDSWVLPKGDGHVLVSPIGATPLPELRNIERIFYFLDTIGPPGNVEVELCGDSIATTFGEMKYRIVKQQKEAVLGPIRETRLSYFLFLQPQDLDKLFTDLRSLKLALGVEYAPEGGGRLQVLK